MHEVSIAQSIISIAEQAAPGDAIVTGVNLQIGELSGIELEALKFAYSVVREKTVLEHADLYIETIEGEAECSNCHTVFPMHYFGANCPRCSSYFVKILKGREMRVVNLTVEEEETHV